MAALMAQQAKEKAENEAFRNSPLAQQNRAQTAQLVSQGEQLRSDERVFLPNRKNPVVLRRNSTALFLLQRVRDEAYEFNLAARATIGYSRDLLKSLDLRTAGALIGR